MPTIASSARWRRACCRRPVGSATSAPALVRRSGPYHRSSRRRASRTRPNSRASSRRATPPARTPCDPEWYDRSMTPPIPIQVYGINLLVRLMVEGPADVRVHCPKGSPIRYGEVIARGDGFDEGANAFREMPELKVVVAFEESAEEVEGPYFSIAGEEDRVIRLDSVILSFPHE